jgi:hypothetical protein
VTAATSMWREDRGPLASSSYQSAMHTEGRTDRKQCEKKEREREKERQREREREREGEGEREREKESVREDLDLPIVCQVEMFQIRKG